MQYRRVRASPMMSTDDQPDPNGTSSHRRILKVRLRQDQVIRLHELRILRGKSIANLLEDILDDYLNRQEYATVESPHKVAQKEPQA